MESTIMPVRMPPRRAAYDVTVGVNVLAGAATWARGCLDASPAKILVVSNRKVSSLYGNVVLRGLADSGFSPHLHLIGDGERFKNFKTLQGTLQCLSENGFTRSDAIVALGGGVVGDLAGFAASVYQRGIPLLQVPTTLLAMIDSSVGGKTAVNNSFGKNLVGTFYQPNGVLIDIDVLKTLPRRELTAGFCEAIKQGAIAGKALFRQTSTFLETYRVAQFRRHFPDPKFSIELVSLLAKQIRFKAGIVQNDEYESIGDISPRSRKILNFGHTLAHALEKVTDYRYLRHGEAVGYGILFAAALSKRLELIGHDEVDLLNDVVRRAGILPAISNIDPVDLLQAFKNDKKRVGNSLQWVLLGGIGKPMIVPDTAIPLSAIKTSLRSILQS